MSGSIAWNERVSAAAREQQQSAATSRARQAGKRRLSGWMAVKDAGTMRRDETLPPAKEGRCPGRTLSKETDPILLRAYHCQHC